MSLIGKERRFGPGIDFRADSGTSGGPGVTPESEVDPEETLQTPENDPLSAYPLVRLAGIDLSGLDMLAQAFRWRLDAARERKSEQVRRERQRGRIVPDGE